MIYLCIITLSISTSNKLKHSLKKNESIKKLKKWFKNINQALNKLKNKTDE